MITRTKSRSSSTVSSEDIEQFLSLAGQFRERSLEPMFEGESPDGEVEKLPGVLDTAFVTGLAASPDPETAGREYGIWGDVADSDLRPSILLLMSVAETCGGVAMCLNAQGVAANLLIRAADGLPLKAHRTALCLQEGHTPPFLSMLDSPAKNNHAVVSTTAGKTGDFWTLNGKKQFVYSMPGVDTFVVLARCGESWGCFAVPADSAGVSMTDAGHRTGLRACSVHHIELNNATVPGEYRIDGGDARRLVIRTLCLNWLGMAAIAAGIARGAVDASRQYAAERYQGGMPIREHPAVKALLGSSDSRVYTSETALRSLDLPDLSSMESLKRCAMLKLTVVGLCAGAVTDSLQCFGGYGYMEDYGMEKKLRDISVLKSAAGSPFYLRQLISDIESAGVTV